MASSRSWTSHPAFAPMRRWLDLRGGDLPGLDALTAWAEEADLALPDGRRLRFVEAPARLSALDYERRIADRGEVPVCPGSWHDAMNALAWLSLPRAKAALNAIHVTHARAGTPNARDRARDAATLLDESGLLFGCDDASLPPLLAAHAWRELFVARAEDVRRHVRPLVIGHGLLERLRTPFRAITAKVLVVGFAAGTLPDEADLATLDAQAAALIADRSFAPVTLHPLPVAALPGWDSERLGVQLFDDASVFRPRPRRSSPEHRA